MTALPDYRADKAAAFGAMGWWQCNANVSAPQAGCDSAPPGIELPGVHPSVQPEHSLKSTKALFAPTPHLVGVAQTDLGSDVGQLFGAVTEADGVFVLFPYRSQPAYPTRTISCLHPGYTGPAAKVGFDGRCRGWYQSAVNSNITQFSSPYIFAGSGLLGVTASNAFVNESLHPPPHNVDTPKSGACLLDYSFDEVATIVKGQLLENGYGYLVDRTTGSAIVHPALDFSNPPPSTAIEAMEFSDIASVDAVAYVQDVLPQVFQRSSGRLDYARGTPSKPWSLSWRHIQLSPYVLVLTVPQEDIEAPIELVESFMQSFIVGMVTALAVILALVFVCIAAVGTRIMQLVVGPVRELKRLASDIQAGKARLSAERYSLRKPTLEVSRLAQALRQLHVLIRVGNSRVVEGDVEFAGPMLTEALEMFKRLGNAKAVGVCYTNLGAVAMQRRDFKEAIDMYRLAVQNSRDIIAKHLSAEEEDGALLGDDVGSKGRSGVLHSTSLYIEEGADSVAEATSGPAHRMHTRLASVMEQDIVKSPSHKTAQDQRQHSASTASAPSDGTAVSVGVVPSTLLDDTTSSLPKLQPMSRAGSTTHDSDTARTDSLQSLGAPAVLAQRLVPLPQLSSGSASAAGVHLTKPAAAGATTEDDFVINHVPLDDEAILTYSARSAAVSDGQRVPSSDGQRAPGRGQGDSASSGSRSERFILASQDTSGSLQASSGGLALLSSSHSTQGLAALPLVAAGSTQAAAPAAAPAQAAHDTITPTHVQHFTSLPLRPVAPRRAHFADDAVYSSSSQDAAPAGSMAKAVSSDGVLPSGADPAVAALTGGDMWGSRGALAHVMHRANTRMALGSELGEHGMPVVAALGDARHAQLLQQLAARQANLAKAYISRARVLADAALVQRLGGYVPAEQEAPLRSLDKSDLAQLRESADDAKQALNALEHAGRHLTAAVPALDTPAEAASAHAAATEAFTDAALAAAAYPTFARRVAALARFARASLVRCQLCLDEAMRDSTDDAAQEDAEHKRVLLQRRVRAAEAAALAAEGKTAAALQQFAASLCIGTVCSRDFDARVLWAMARLLLDGDEVECARRTATLAGAHVSGPREFSFVVDNSSSMAEGRLIDVAMDNVLSLYDTYVLPIDRVGLITYTRRAVVRIEPRRKGTERRAAKTRALIDACRTPRGGTACYDAILAALMQQVARAAAAAHGGKRTSARFVIVVTDGSDTMSRASAQDTLEIVRQVCVQTPITLHIVGVGLLQNEEAMRKIAAASAGGQYVPTDATRDSMDSAFNHISAAVAEVYVEAV